MVSDSIDLFWAEKRSEARRIPLAHCRAAAVRALVSREEDTRMGAELREARASWPSDLEAMRRRSACVPDECAVARMAEATACLVLVVKSHSRSAW